MMMTQSYYGGEFDPLSRPNYRAAISGGHYGRHTTYGHAYYEPQHELRSEYAGRQNSRTSIQEQNTETGPAGPSRRRIQVACSRCRRRKIKCTGDPGDGSGCSACRSAQADKSSCTFIRVGSREVPLPGLEVLPTSASSVTSSAPTPAPYASETPSNSYNAGSSQVTHHRPSLPMLHTRTAYAEYDAYNTSPVDDYSYTSGTMPRHESISSNYSTEGFRPYTTGSMSAPSAVPNLYYEPGAAFSFGTLHTAPGYQPNAPMARLPSVSADAFSPLNMSSLHSSLPTQTVQERRLPAPYTPQYATYTSTEVPQIRPLTSFAEPQHRTPVGGIYSRNSMSWSMPSPAASRTASTNGTSASTHGLPGMASVQTGSNQSNVPILGYQFSAAPGSPEVSPTARPAPSESFSGGSSASSVGASMLPPSNVRYGHATALNTLPITTESGELRRTSSSRDTSASLYSFSSGIDASGRATPSRRVSQPGEEVASPALHQTYAPLRHPQPQHAASVDELRRRSSYDQQHAATSHRMSVSNLDARY
ncbi:Putative zn(2)-C6 fungal-type DNA-binding domain-containing protein [Septoria linicola]|uniref:Zn(2)-C6 fungal-type DNA-binding domain-containing protein n=1 Tax=Septoria linicola TaxID=215465 RepID=A0A9Q9ANM1_9PEZI|nr:putative zn(2)-C6 fungal-type DNA-binding domain-containing protein [Septoria linicola]USW49302.1 Putative zn(2)-C6 fungal-type DNA-binding domain-containing protein [Septoria linicola]